jgi:hypothetical protein
MATGPTVAAEAVVTRVGGFVASAVVPLTFTVDGTLPFAAVAGLKPVCKRLALSSDVRDAFDDDGDINVDVGGLFEVVPALGPRGAVASV